LHRKSTTNPVSPITQSSAQSSDPVLNSRSNLLVTGNKMDNLINGTNEVFTTTEYDYSDMFLAEQTCQRDVSFTTCLVAEEKINLVPPTIWEHQPLAANKSIPLALSPPTTSPHPSCNFLFSCPSFSAYSSEKPLGCFFGKHLKNEKILGKQNIIFTKLFFGIGNVS
ncbi:hypothetical protein L345_16429, partial [Ophiophagus hannah]